MTSIEISTVLNAPAETVYEHAQTSQLLHYVTRGVLSFHPIDPPEFPERWRDGEYKTGMRWKGVLPIGWQVIRIETQPVRGDVRSLRDNGYGPLIRKWDHMIEIRPVDAGCSYVDRLDLEAGLLTPVVAAFASRFYRHRQKRWRRLVANSFDYTK